MSMSNMTSTPFRHEKLNCNESHLRAFDMSSPPIVLNERHEQQQMLQDGSYVQRLDQQLRAQREDSTAQAHPNQSRNLNLKIPEEFSTSAQDSLQMIPSRSHIEPVSTPREQCPECVRKSMMTPKDDNSFTMCSICASRERRMPAQTICKTTTPQSSKQVNARKDLMPRLCHEENNFCFLSDLPSQKPSANLVEVRLTTAPGLNIEFKMEDEGQDGRINLRPRKHSRPNQSLSPKQAEPQSSALHNEPSLALPLSSSHVELSLAPRSRMPRALSAPLLPLMSPMPHINHDFS